MKIGQPGRPFEFCSSTSFKNAIPEREECVKLEQADLADFANHLHGKIFHRVNVEEKDSYPRRGNTRLTDIIKELGKGKLLS